MPEQINAADAVQRAIEKLQDAREVAQALTRSPRLAILLSTAIALLEETALPAIESVNRDLSAYAFNTYGGDARLYNGIFDLETIAQQAIADKRRVDRLEAYINKNRALLLHDGSVMQTGFFGLGLRPGNLNRSLREAVDQMAALQEKDQ